MIENEFSVATFASLSNFIHFAMIALTLKLATFLSGLVFFQTSGGGVICGTPNQDSLYSTLLSVACCYTAISSAKDDCTFFFKDVTTILSRKKIN